MRLTRVHVDLPLTVGTRLRLPERAGAHLYRVLRLRVGDGFALFNGDGRDYRARLTATSKSGVDAEILGAESIETESPIRLILAQALARGEKMDWILQKATELGVAAIAPIVSERTEVRLDDQRGARRLEHWRAVTVAACEQCGRARLPDLSPPRLLPDWAAGPSVQAGTPLRLTLEPNAETTLSGLSAPTPIQTVILAIGPEGGWSERDLTQLDAAGFLRLRLGPRVLRTETAGPAALAALQTRFGDLG